jgi:hypothetical protein
MEPRISLSRGGGYRPCTIGIILVQSTQVDHIDRVADTATIHPSSTIAKLPRWYYQLHHGWYRRPCRISTNSTGYLTHWRLASTVASRVE